MKSLLIVGAGEYGQVVKEIAELNGYEKIDFIDDNSELAVGKVEQIEGIEPMYDGSIVAIGNSSVRKSILQRLNKAVTLIHPTATVSKYAVVEKGCVIEAKSVVNTAAVIKEGSYICAGAVVNHNAVVEKYCQIDCNAVIAMGIDMPEGAKIMNRCKLTCNENMNINMGD